MNGESNREVAIFTEALKVPLAERNAFLERECGGNEDLRRRLEAILKAYDQLGNFLEKPSTGDQSNETN
jgi:eukaryotic-like serine/threonine-protein kinase